MLSSQADLITAFMYAWKPKSPTLECFDFTTGEPIEVVVPAGSTPSELSDKLYSRARKLRRSVVALQQLLGQTDSQLAYLGEIASSLQAVEVYRVNDDVVTLREIEEELDALADSVLLRRVVKEEGSVFERQVHGSYVMYDCICCR
jgi:predicted ribosome quality control (RQC) complex YloA/Tae2 family protein